MKRHLVLFLAILSSCFLSARTMYVVSVGIKDYKYITKLKKAENDAKTFSQLYLTHTTHVTTLVGSNATHDNILSTMKRVFSQASKDDIVVFFFSGHGSKGGLCAYDTNSNSTSVSYSEIQSVMRQCRASSKQMFIDACFSGGLRSNGSSSSTAQSTFSNANGIMLFLSSRTSETSRENIYGDNGYFTQYLVKGIKGGADSNGDKVITAKEIFTYVSKNVSSATAGKQNPVMWGKFSDEMRIMSWNKQ